MSLPEDMVGTDGLTQADKDSKLSPGENLYKTLQSVAETINFMFEAGIISSLES